MIDEHLLQPIRPIIDIIAFCIIIIAIVYTAVIKPQKVEFVLKVVMLARNHLIAGCQAAEIPRLNDSR